MIRSVVYTGLALVLACCRPTPASTPESGVRGQVYWMEGDFMPSIGQPPAGKKKPVSKEILFYPALTANEVGGQTGPLYQQLPGTPVATVTSASNGEFTVFLAPGIYSVFTREPNGYFANRFDGQGIINPVEVKAGIFSEIVLEINYKAVY